jgi:hypothetical protein
MHRTIFPSTSDFERTGRKETSTHRCLQPLVRLNRPTDDVPLLLSLSMPAIVVCRDLDGSLRDADGTDGEGGGEGTAGTEAVRVEAERGSVKERRGRETGGWGKQRGKREKVRDQKGKTYRMIARGPEVTARTSRTKKSTIATPVQQGSVMLLVCIDFAAVFSSRINGEREEKDGKTERTHPNTNQTHVDPFVLARNDRVPPTTRPLPRFRLSIEVELDPVQAGGVADGEDARGDFSYIRRECTEVSGERERGELSETNPF